MPISADDFDKLECMINRLIEMTNIGNCIETSKVSHGLISAFIKGMSVTQLYHFTRD